MFFVVVVGLGLVLVVVVVVLELLFVEVLPLEEVGSVLFPVFEAASW